MIRLIAAALSALFLLQSAAWATDRVRLGYGRLVTNDLIGDGRDRWRTGSIASSRVWGPDWKGELPARFGDLIELRFNAEIFAPEDVAAPAPGDRPYAGAISLGLHTHFQQYGNEFTVGGDLVFTGPQTQLDDFQGLVHDVVGGDDLAGATRRNQIGNDLNPTGVVEMGRTLSLGQAGLLRPFIEGRAGAETLVRVGADLSFGNIGHGELLVRDPVTGHRYRTVLNDLAGYSFLVGGDIAYVDHSEFLPSNRGLQTTDHRSRLRAGVHWQSEKGHRAFYGLTWLDKEFEGQRDTQIVGSVRLHVNF